MAILSVAIFLYYLSYQIKNFQIFIFATTFWFGLLFTIKKFNKKIITPIFSVLIIFTIIETSLFIFNGKLSFNIKKNKKHQTIHVKNKDTILGYQPLKGIQNHKLYKDGQLIFNKFYTISENNYRITPRINNLQIKDLINFFGGSITFGWGLDDDETLPFFFQKYFKNSLINNYAISGYGAHQAYTQITKINNMVGDINIFVTFKNHIPRSSCKRDFSLGTPRYIIKDKKIYQKGFCGSINLGKFRLPEIILKIIKKSEIKILIDKIYLRKFLFDKEGLDLYLNLINEINLFIKNQNKKFIIAYISEDDELDNLIIDYFEKNAINFVDLSLDKKNAENFIPNDGHPSKEANQKRAKILSEFIKNLN